MMTKPAAAPPKRASNRDKIVAAAVECFVRKGFHQSSVRDIAQKAGVSLGNLYNHFAGKEALIAEIARLDSDSAAPVLAPLEDRSQAPEAALDAFCDAYLARAAQPVDAVLTADITAEALRNPGIAAEFAALQSRIRTALAALIERGAQAGTFDRSVQPDLAADLLLDSLQGLAQRAGLAERTPSAAELETQQMMRRRFLGISDKKRGHPISEGP